MTKENENECYVFKILSLIVHSDALVAIQVLRDRNQGLMKKSALQGRPFVNGSFRSDYRYVCTQMKHSRKLVF